MVIKNFVSGPLDVNCYLVWDENTKKGFIVDPGGTNANLIQCVQENELDIEYIVLTHGHGDHIGGVTDYRERFASKLVASEDEKLFLLDSEINFSKEVLGRPLTFVADLYVKEGEHLQIGDMDLQFIMTPGHTPGGMCILVNGSLFSGDTLFCQSIGRTDFPGGSFEYLITAIKEKLFPLPNDTKVYPGHMGTTSIGYEKEHNPFV